MADDKWKAKKQAKVEAKQAYAESTAEYDDSGDYKILHLMMKCLFFNNQLRFGKCKTIVIFLHRIKKHLASFFWENFSGFDPGYKLKKWHFSKKN